MHRVREVGARLPLGVAEIKRSGDDVTIVDAQGNQRAGIVGRVKIERRPLMLVEAEVDGNIIKNILQNAETIKLVDTNGEPISIAELKPGDEVEIRI